MTQSTVVYFSRFGNTCMVADRIANTLSSAGPVREISCDDLSVSDIEKMDLVVMGTPTHNMNLPKNVRPVLEEPPHKIVQRNLFCGLRHLLQDVLVAQPLHGRQTTCPEVEKVGR